MNVGSKWTVEMVERTVLDSEGNEIVIRVPLYRRKDGEPYDFIKGEDLVRYTELYEKRVAEEKMEEE